MNLAADTLPTQPTRNPRSGAFDHDMPVYDAAAVANAVAAQPLTARLDRLAAFATALAVGQGALVDALTADTGRRSESGVEVQATIGTIARWRENATTRRRCWPTLRRDAGACRPDRATPTAVRRGRHHQPVELSAAAVAD